MLTANFDTCVFRLISPATGRIDVMMRDDRRLPYTHVPLRAYGTLAVQPQTESGWLVGLYWMAADFVDVAAPGR